MERPPHLPEVTRLAWVSDVAQRQWQPRLAAVRGMWSDMEWLSVVHGVRSCALVTVSDASLPEIKRRWMALGLSAAGLPNGTRIGRAGRTYTVFVGLRRHTREAEHAFSVRDDDAVGSLLGYPACCRSFCREDLDTTWAMAGAEQTASGVVDIEPNGSTFANLLWRRLGVRAVPHLPCSFHCKETVAVGMQFRALAEQVQCGSAWRWLEEILSWPAQWSALHGIAEIKTPILKMVTRTDAAERKQIVNWKGGGYPPEGAAGRRFPYRTLRRPPQFSLRASSAPAKPPGRILDAVLAGLSSEARENRRVARFRLSNYFNVVELDDGSVGAAMSYARLSAQHLDDKRKALEEARARDPLLLEATAAADDLLSLSLRVSIVSALSAPLLRAGEDPRFNVSQVMPGKLFGGVTSALVIGFGGYMESLAGSRGVRRLHVADLQYAARRAEMDAVAARYRQARPELDFSLSDGSALGPWMRGADLVCISGSTLCNGSLERLLEAASQGPVIVLQGQSASVHPVELFLRGVSLVSTTLKPANLVDLYDRNLLTGLLEGGLPCVYLTPETSR
jgi:Putative heavy-metal chelation